MKFSFTRFNLYLMIAASLAFASGCASDAKKKEKKDATSIALHLEAHEDGTDRNGPVPIFREKPVYVNVDKEPFLDEGSIDSARIADDPDGSFHIELKFNWRGAMILDGVTSDNHNRRIAVVAVFGKGPRWLGAPLIKRRMSDGIFRFTPDATREEAERIVKGLNNVAVEVRKQDKL
jgi:preprotein translocase subunit SecD